METKIKYNTKDMDNNNDGLPTWISVNDRLPHKDGKSSIFVLVYDTYNEIIVRPYNEYHNCWYDEDADDYYCDAVGGKITHWMPLPESPK